MTAEQLTTILTNLLTSGGIVTFFFFMVRSLKREITGLNKTIEAQNKTLEVMEKRVAETEKVGDIYRNLVSDLPDWVEKYKKFINDSKDDVIAKLQQDKTDDEQLKEARQIELKRLELQEQLILELPKLRDQMITAFEAIEERIDTIQPDMFNNIYRPARLTLKPSIKNFKNIILIDRDLNNTPILTVGGNPIDIEESKSEETKDSDKSTSDDE